MRRKQSPQNDIQEYHLVVNKNITIFFQHSRYVKGTKSSYLMTTNLERCNRSSLIYKKIVFLNL
jgi:hypothetical protein